VVFPFRCGSVTPEPFFTTQARRIFPAGLAEFLMIGFLGRDPEYLPIPVRDGVA